MPLTVFRTPHSRTVPVPAASALIWTWYSAPLVQRTLQYASSSDPDPMKNACAPVHLSAIAARKRSVLD
jgi:hypothetical protein